MTGKSAGDGMGRERAELFQTHLAALNSERREYAEEVERKAFDKMFAQIDQEKDLEIREFMTNTLRDFCGEGVRLSVKYKSAWVHLIEERRVHQKAVEPLDLFLDLEAAIAKQVDSSRYTAGARQLRYPLTVPGNGNEESRSTRNFNAGEPRASLYNSYYKFGSHHLHVGHAIAEVMRHLEKRYGLDFRKLERERQQARGDAS